MMPFKIKDVLIVNATIIIGLLILLTFQSISSSFIETESADFMREWHTVQNQYATTVGLLEDWDCIEDKTFLEGLVVPNPYGFDHDVSKEMEGEIKKNCSKWLIQSLEQERHFLSLSEWGYNFHYLQQMDRDGYLYHAATTKEHVHVGYVNTCTVEHPLYNPETESCQSMEPLLKKKYVDIVQSDFNPEFVVVESTYFKAIVTGPFYVNIVNLLVMFPFIASAVIASFNAFRQNEETNKASRTAVVLMGIGFIGLLIGLIFVIFAFFEVYGPFLDQYATETWSYDTNTGMNITETMPSPETRSEP